MFENVKYDLTRIAYGRRGTFYYLSVYDEELWVCALLSGLDTAGPGGNPRCGKLFPVLLERDGKPVLYKASATPICVTLDYDGGSARLCLEEDSILRMEAENIDVVFRPQLKPHEIAKDRNDGSWEVTMNPAKLMFCPVRGEMSATFSFDVINSIPEGTAFRFTADADGKVDLAIHLYKSNAWRLAKYPEFDSVIVGIEKEFSEYMETVPELPEEFSEARVINAFIIWSHIIPVDDIELIYMNKGVHRMTSSWQQSYHAMGQTRNPKFAWELMLSVFKYQDEYGMLPDCFFDTYQTFGGCKPPFQGVALDFLKKYTDFSFAPRKEVMTLYRGLSDLVYWWLSYRDTDNDGIAQYDAADESGWDDVSFFKDGGAAETPDLATYMILSMESLADMAERLGKTYEMREWRKRADDMLKKTIEFFWNGEMFAARTNETHEWIDADTLVAFVPLLLGKDRLPQEIIDKLAEKLSVEGDWLSPYGFAGEKLGSPHYHETGWSAGPVLAPAQLLVCLGLHNSGKDELAKEVALRYCRALVKNGFPMVINPKTGKDVSEGRWGERYPNRMAWTAVVFLILGSELL